MRDFPPTTSTDGNTHATCLLLNKAHSRRDSFVVASGHSALDLRSVVSKFTVDALATCLRSRKNGEDCQKTRSKRRRKKDAQEEPAANRVLVRVVKFYPLSRTAGLPKPDIGRVGAADRNTGDRTSPPRHPRVAQCNFFVGEIRSPLAK